jgi:hypothetical protein
MSFRPVGIMGRKLPIFRDTVFITGEEWNSEKG